jgi:hypothetical protein
VTSDDYLTLLIGGLKRLRVAEWILRSHPDGEFQQIEAARGIADHPGEARKALDQLVVLGLLSRREAPGRRRFYRRREHVGWEVFLAARRAADSMTFDDDPG